MKRVIFALIVIVVIITVGILEQVYIKKTLDGIRGQAVAIQSLIGTDNEEAYKLSLELKENWLSNKHIAESVVSHNETREITIKVSELEGYIKADDDKSAHAVVNMLIEMCDNYKQILGFSLDTIL